jgi:phosphoglycolate phosphatase
MQLLFDLDGTLTDPVVGITRCIQHAMSKLDREAAPAGDLARFVGPPLGETFAELLSTDDLDLIGRAVALYRGRFATVGMFENAIYPDVAEGLGELAADGHRLWVVTSKPQTYAQRIIDHFELGSYFHMVYGSELDGRNADKGDLIRLVLQHEDIRPEDTWMIGDRAHDLRGGRVNGVRTAGVLWGYGSEEELLAETPDLLVRRMADLVAHFRRASDR